MIKQAISTCVMTTAVPLAPRIWGFTFSPLPLSRWEKSVTCCPKNIRKMPPSRVGFCKTSFQLHPAGLSKCLRHGSLHLGSGRARRMVRTFQGHEMLPIWGTLTPPMSLPSEQVPHPRAHLVPQALKARDFQLCQGSRDPGRPGNVPTVKTEATHRISQLPHHDIFSNLDLSSMENLEGKVISRQLLKSGTHYLKLAALAFVSARSQPP